MIARPGARRPGSGLTDAAGIGYGAGMAETPAVMVTVKGEKGYAQAIRAAGHAWTSDEPPARGGSDTGPTPTALYLSGLGACTAITLRMYADRKGWELGSVQVRCTLFPREEGRPRIEREIRLGAPLSDEQKAKLSDIADRTPVTKLVMNGAELETRLV